jgi:hypothetical protein
MNPSTSISPFQDLRRRGLVVIALIAALAAAMSLFALRTATPTTSASLAPAASTSSGLLDGLLPSASLATIPVVASAPVAAASPAKSSTSTSTPTSTTEVMEMPETTDTCTGLNKSVDAFLQHVYAAHLETGVGQQVTDILNLDQYLTTHLVLVENMLKPVLGGAQSTLDTFMQHVYAAHLETGLGQQVADITDIDQYAKTHTVLVENMIKPLVGTDLSSC